MKTKEERKEIMKKLKAFLKKNGGLQSAKQEEFFDELAKKFIEGEIPHFPLNLFIEPAD
mgnify:CR=1 FL=1